MARIFSSFVDGLMGVSVGSRKTPFVLQVGQVTSIFSPGFPWIKKFFLQRGHAMVIAVMFFFTSSSFCCSGYSFKTYNFLCHTCMIVYI